MKNKTMLSLIALSAVALAFVGGRALATVVAGDPCTNTDTSVGGKCDFPSGASGAGPAGGLGPVSLTGTGVPNQVQITVKSKDGNGNGFPDYAGSGKFDAVSGPVTITVKKQAGESGGGQDALCVTIADLCAYLSANPKPTLEAKKPSCPAGEVPSASNPCVCEKKKKRVATLENANVLNTGALSINTVGTNN